ncbi:glycolate oxidase [Arthrobacter sp. V4I6]|uniref:FAD-binding oxidoreductase n=1 Tax=unclassified Arthrobacter TaxID=235627 RepID=UPI002780E3E0|nr:MULTISPECIES: FAD-linked oxidase C-terminal domain-containing protein [unclassified Arthrobacter]MDQ0822992.1 glycolate oxidase [Arthrobacter sp. V1I7]MDQ0852620.1 glycolate oxidase [Arthrobacter sp. V4I6]
MNESIIGELQAICPEVRISTDEAVLASNAVDQSPVLDFHLPIAVVWPVSVSEVQTVMKLAHSQQISVVTRGAGTGVSGGAHATRRCIVLNLQKMDKILEIHPEDEIARVEPGVINVNLNTAVAEYGLMFAPDPGSYRQSTLGGNIATNAGGLRCAKYGVTRDSVLALEVVLADGTLITTGHRTFKGVAGYDLTGLFVGSEGTLGVVVGATVRLRYLPREVHTIAAFFPAFTDAAAGVLAIGQARIQPSIMEMLDANTLSQLDRLRNTQLRALGGALLLIQTDGFGAAAEAAHIRTLLESRGATLLDDADGEAAALVELRRGSRGGEIDDEYSVGEDVAVPRSRLVDYIAEMQRMAVEHGVGLKVVAHAGDGNLHPTFWVGSGQKDKVPHLDAALDESVRVALAMGGTITGEHGIGQYKVRWLPLEQQDEVLEIQREIKRVLDPTNILNPGKILPALN